MRKICLLFALLLSLSLLFSCSEKSENSTPSVKQPASEELPPLLEDEAFFDVLNVHYIRTDGYNENFKYPRIIEINSQDELVAYYNYFNGIYSLGHRENVYSDTTVGFADVMEEYTDEYFLTSKLYLVVLEEGSGSIRHEVEGLVGGDLRIKTLSPECCTDDMAEWHIFVDVNRDAAIDSINGKSVPIYTPDEIYSEFMSLLDKTARDYLRERYSIADVSLTFKESTDFGSIKDTGFYNPLGYSPGYDSSPVWIVECAAVDIGSFTLYLCDSPFVFGSHGLDKWQPQANYEENILEEVRESIPSLNMATLKDLVKRYGKEASWDTFAPYWCVETGSGLYILHYPIDFEYSFVIGGSSPIIEPMYMRLVSEYDGSYIDVREEDIDEFISRTKVISEFNYRDDAVLYKKDTEGVKTEGFVNAEPSEIITVMDAVNLAKKECSVEYDTVKICYDYTKGVWKINFSKFNTLGGDQTVYIDRNGITLMRVSGE